MTIAEMRTELTKVTTKIAELEELITEWTADQFLEWNGLRNAEQELNYFINVLQ